MRVCILFKCLHKRAGVVYVRACVIHFCVCEKVCLRLCFVSVVIQACVSVYVCGVVCVCARVYVRLVSVCAWQQTEP